MQNHEPVGTFKTGSTAWTVRVSHKRFYATASGFPEVGGDSWEQMENHAKVLASKSKIKVAVPYVAVEGFMHGTSAFRFQDRTATGIHAANGNVTFTDAAGKPGQESGRGSSFMKPFSSDDRAEYLELLEQIRKLTAGKNELERKYQFDGGLKAEVSREIDKAHAAKAETGDE